MTDPNPSVTSPTSTTARGPPAGAFSYFGGTAPSFAKPPLKKRDEQPIPTPTTQAPAPRMPVPPVPVSSVDSHTTESRNDNRVTPSAVYSNPARPVPPTRKAPPTQTTETRPPPRPSGPPSGRPAPAPTRTAAIHHDEAPPVRTAPQRPAPPRPKQEAIAQLVAKKPKVTPPPLPAPRVPATAVPQFNQESTETEVPKAAPPARPPPPKPAITHHPAPIPSPRSRPVSIRIELPKGGTKDVEIPSVNPSTIPVLSNTSRNPRKLRKSVSLQDFEVEKYKQQQQQWKNYVSEQQKLEEVLDVLNSFSYDSESDTDDFAPTISSRGTRSYGLDEEDLQRKLHESANIVEKTVEEDVIDFTKTADVMSADVIDFSRVEEVPAEEKEAEKEPSPTVMRPKRPPPPAPVVETTAQEKPPKHHLDLPQAVGQPKVKHRSFQEPADTNPRLIRSQTTPVKPATTTAAPPQKPAEPKKSRPMSPKISANASSSSSRSQVKTFYSNNTIRAFESEPEPAVQVEPEVTSPPPVEEPVVEVKIAEKVEEKILPKIEKIAEIPPRKGTGTVRALQGTLFHDNVVRYGVAPGNTAPSSVLKQLAPALATPDLAEGSPSAERTVPRAKIGRSMSTPLLPDWQKMKQFQERLDEAKKHTQKEGQVKTESSNQIPRPKQKKRGIGHYFTSLYRSFRSKKRRNRSNTIDTLQKPIRHEIIMPGVVQNFYNGMKVRVKEDQSEEGNYEEKSIGVRKGDVIYVTNINHQRGVFHGKSTLNLVAQLSIVGNTMYAYHKGKHGTIAGSAVEPYDDHERKDTNLDDPSRYFKLLDILMQPDLTVATAFCNVSNKDEFREVSNIWVTMLSARGHTMELLKKLIYLEVEWSTDAGTLFRGNNVATSIIGAFTKAVGTDYLKLVLGPTIRKIQNDPSKIEVDPSKLGGKDPSENMQTLMETSQSLFDLIVSSLPSCPHSIRNLCYLLQSSSRKKFPGKELFVVSGFYFLRFISPAIVTPDVLGIVEGPLDPHTRRALVLLSKIIQSIANTGSGFTEEYMKPLNAYVTETSDSMRKFLENLSKTWFDDATEPTESQNDDVIAIGALHKLHQMIAVNLTRLGLEVDYLRQMQIVQTHLDHNPWEDLLKEMSYLGPPATVRAEYRGNSKQTIRGNLTAFLKNRPKHEDLVDKKIL